MTRPVGRSPRARGVKAGRRTPCARTIPHRGRGVRSHDREGDEEVGEDDRDVHQEESRVRSLQTRPSMTTSPRRDRAPRLPGESCRAHAQPLGLRRVVLAEVEDRELAARLVTPGIGQDDLAGDDLGDGPTCWRRGPRCTRRPTRRRPRPQSACRARTRRPCSSSTARKMGRALSWALISSILASLPFIRVRSASFVRCSASSFSPSSSTRTI